MSRKLAVESLGLVAVVVSLVFVGLEIRQNNSLAQAAAYQAIGIATSDAWFELGRDDEMARLYYLAPVDSLEAVDWLRLYADWTGHVRLVETLLLQVEQDLLPPDAMQRLGYADFDGILSDPVFACLWPSIRTSVSSSLIDFIEGTRSQPQPDCSQYPIPPTL